MGSFFSHIWLWILVKFYRLRSRVFRRRRLTSAELESLLLRHIYGKLVPKPLYVALHTTDPDSGESVELSAPGYARQLAEVKVERGDLTVVSPVEFASPSDNSWGTVTSFALYDSVSGHKLYEGDINEIIHLEEEPIIEAGELSLTEEGEDSEEAEEDLEDREAIDDLLRYVEKESENMSRAVQEVRSLLEKKRKNEDS